jgi:putative acetyltransferase
MSDPTPHIKLRPYHASDGASLARLFRASVQTLAKEDYTTAQRLAWAPDAMDAEKFAKRCAAKETWIAEIEDRIAGFSDLEPDGHIDMLYVHPDFHRQGVARALLEHIEARARTLDLRRLYTEASITARPVFEAQGFRVIVPQLVTLRGESMTNYRMEKRLHP